MSITWVTSFNDRIYKSSGQKLLASFLNMAPDGKMFIGTENCNDLNLPLEKCFWFYSIDEHPLLKTFLTRNADIIPITAGGKAKYCRCKTDKKHKKGCHFTWWNRHHFRWYRKFVSLQCTLKTFPKTDYLIWIDADCYFKTKSLSERFIQDVLFAEDDFDCFFLKGPDRPVMEAGLVGYNMKTKGKELLEEICEYYESGKYRALDRWDDSFIIQKFLQRPQYHCNDIAGRKGEHAEVFSDSLIGQYIHHNKGQHGRVEGIFK